MLQVLAVPPVGPDGRRVHNRDFFFPFDPREEPWAAAWAEFCPEPRGGSKSVERDG